jgi:hypothetical protein
MGWIINGLPLLMVDLPTRLLVFMTNLQKLLEKKLEMYFHKKLLFLRVPITILDKW